MSSDDASIPDDLAAALESEPVALASYRRLPPSHRHEYLEWIDEAKRPQTRRRRIEKTIRMLHG
ncbi:MAG: YdeI/OmpD-associated family protein [bacterium]|nr:YdeI/OmpD-associated family protein [bacterium]